MELSQLDKPTVPSLLEDGSANTAANRGRLDDSGFDLDESLYELPSDSDEEE